MRFRGISAAIGIFAIAAWAPQPVSAQQRPSFAGKTITMTANRFAGAGVQFSSRRFTAQIRGTYRNDNEISGTRTLVKGTTDNYLRRFEPAETRIDVNVSYQITDRYSVFVIGRDVSNSSRKVVLRDYKGLFPAYAHTCDKRLFRVTCTVGVRGMW